MDPHLRMDPRLLCLHAALLLYFNGATLSLADPDSPSAPVNVSVKLLNANSAIVTWDVLEEEVVIGFAISQQVSLLIQIYLLAFLFLLLLLHQLMFPRGNICEFQCWKTPKSPSPEEKKRQGMHLHQAWANFGPPGVLDFNSHNS
uniref:Fibronectin type-III domain-containing protein n=1 Tax=Anolis carolinensis TaxID=28377 RepID=A0A803THW9_ANOCA